MYCTDKKIPKKLYGVMSLVALSMASTVPAATAQTASVQIKGYVSTMPAPVRLAGEEVFTITSDAGEFTKEERTIIIEKNVNNALVASKDRSPTAVEVVKVNRLPVIRIGGKHCLTIDHVMAAQHGMTMDGLADRWANNMRAVLSDQAKVYNYVSQLGGDWLYSPYSNPYRRAQWEQARKNISAKGVKESMPLDLVCSDSLETAGFESMLKREPAKAEAFFRRALTMEPRNQRAHYGLGLSLMKQGRIDESIPELEMARWLDHDDAQVHIALGNALESKGMDKEAITRYREASLLQPENPESFLAIADLREEKNDIGRSVRELTEAHKNLPESEYIRLKLKDQYTWRLIRPY